MNVELEKVIILLVIGAFVVTSANSLVGLDDSITRAEAVEISKNSNLVKEGLAIAYRFAIETNYYNSSMVEQLKLGHNREIYEKVPKGHSVWQVVWWFRYKEGMATGYTVIVIVDAETGTIIHEEKGILYG